MLFSLFFYRMLKTYMLEENLYELFCNCRVVIEKMTDFVLSRVFSILPTWQDIVSFKALLLEITVYLSVGLVGFLWKNRNKLLRTALIK